MTIGEKIRYYRELNGMTQENVAASINTTKQTIYKYESGIITNIPLENIETMARLFHISPVDLTNWGNEKPVTISDDGLWEKIKNDESKLILAQWISSLNDDQLKMVVELLRAARLAPEE